MPFRPEPGRSGVLFDLDGTLLDTAPDMIRALNALRAEECLPPLPYETLRGQVSHGSQGLVLAGFGENLSADRIEALRARFLELYAATLCRDTRLFAGMDLVLDALERAGIAWGVVTNKPGRFTLPLLEALGLDVRSACIVSGDTLPQRKPHPAPLLLAARLCGLSAPACLYVGDAERDIAAGRAAGMTTALAAWGYLSADDDPACWGADWHLPAPCALLDRLAPG